MLSGIVKAAESPHGRAAISFIIGLGLASLFRHTCGERGCIEFRAPPLEPATRQTYEYGGRCVRFDLNAGPCDSDKSIIEVA